MKAVIEIIEKRIVERQNLYGESPNGLKRLQGDGSYPLLIGLWDVLNLTRYDTADEDASGYQDKQGQWVRYSELVSTISNALGLSQ